MWIDPGEVSVKVLWTYAKRTSEEILYSKVPTTPPTLTTKTTTAAPNGKLAFTNTTKNDPRINIFTQKKIFSQNSQFPIVRPADFTQRVPLSQEENDRGWIKFDFERQSEISENYNWEALSIRT